MKVWCPLARLADYVRLCAICSVGAVCCALAVGSDARADIVNPYVGVQLTGSGNGGGTPLGSSVIAGVVPQDNFNVAAGQSGGPQTLSDASGNPTGISFTWAANDSWTTGVTANGPNGVGDPTLLSGEDKVRGTATYSLTNVPAGTYDLIAYTLNDVRNEGSTTITTGTTAGPTVLYNVDQQSSDWTSSPTYLNGGSTTNSVSLTPGNYVEFLNVSPVGGTLAFSHAFVGAVGSDTVSYNGFQLVSVVPEPSTFVLFAIGAAGLGIVARRRSTR